MAGGSEGIGRGRQRQPAWLKPQVRNSPSTSHGEQPYLPRNSHLEREERKEGNRRSGFPALVDTGGCDYSSCHLIVMLSPPSWVPTQQFSPTPRNDLLLPTSLPQSPSLTASRKSLLITPPLSLATPGLCSLKFCSWTIPPLCVFLLVLSVPGPLSGWVSLRRVACFLSFPFLPPQAWAKAGVPGYLLNELTTVGPQSLPGSGGFHFVPPVSLG